MFEMQSREISLLLHYLSGHRAMTHDRRHLGMLHCSFRHCTQRIKMSITSKLYIVKCAEDTGGWIARHQSDDGLYTGDKLYCWDSVRSYVKLDG